MTNKQQWKMAWQAWRKRDWLNLSSRFLEAAKYADTGRIQYCGSGYPFLNAAIQRGHKSGISVAGLRRYVHSRAGNFENAIFEREKQLAGRV